MCVDSSRPRNPMGMIAPNDVRAAAQKLAFRIKRQTSSPHELLKMLQVSIEELYSESSELIVPLKSLLAHSGMVNLLNSKTANERWAQRETLHKELATTFTPAMLSLLMAFVDGVMAAVLAKQNAVEPLREVNFRDWIGGICIGTFATGMLGIFLLFLNPLRSPQQQQLTIGPKSNHDVSERDTATESLTSESSNGPVQILPVVPPKRGAWLSVETVKRCATSNGIAQEIQAPADPSNYGERQIYDWMGRPLYHYPQLIVLHETVLDETKTLRTFQTPHPNDNDQVSYHMLIAADGRRLRVVPDEKRAYGASPSAFGAFNVKAKQSSGGSINNIALHVSLVTPFDGQSEDPTYAHSGYTNAQYRNLAAQVLFWQALYGIPMAQVTTHAAVDRSHSRYDPRSFRWDQFDREHEAQRQNCGWKNLG